MKLEEYLQKIRTCPDEDLSDKSRYRSKLEVECGIYDNWPILLGENQDKSARAVRDLSPYELRLGGQFCLYDRILGALSKRKYAFKFQTVDFGWAKSRKEKAKGVHLEFKTDLSAHYAKDIRRIVSELARGLPSKVDITPMITTVFDYVPGAVIVQVMNRVGSEATYEPGYDHGKGPHRRRQLANFDVAFLLHPYNDNQKFPYHMRHRMMAKVIDEIGTYAIKKNLRLCFPKSVPKGDKEEEDLSKIVYFNA